jgi:acetoin utilization deacetylase AcuC-like enzyme
VNKTIIVFSPIYYRHNPGKSHPESAKRLHTIINELEKSGLTENKNLQLVHPDKASIEDIELVHAVEYIRLVEAVCKSGGGLLDLQDTVVSPESFEVALCAAGGALKAVDLVMKGKCENAFAMVRPPGHHAGKYRALGFCLFNNVAIAAEHLLRRFKVKRVLILDVDAHHGNGTQEKFYDRSDVLYISLHEDPSSFPGTGFIDEIGEGKGLGYNVNIPLPFGTTDHVYLKAMKEILTQFSEVLKPNGYCVLIIGDSRKRGVVPLGSYLTQIGLKLGFNLWDLMIYDTRFGGKQVNKFRKIRSQQKKFHLTDHDYILVFQKREKGWKYVNVDDIFA